MGKMIISKRRIEEIVNESIKKVLNEDLLLEYTNDTKPVVCFIIGAPGAGKTTWMKQEANKFLYQQFQELDIDNTLRQFQLKTCNEIAEELLYSLSKFNNAKNHTRDNFDTVKQKIQQRLNNQTDAAGSKGMYIDITQIQLDDRIGKRTLLEWAQNYSEIKQEKLSEFLDNYKKEFYYTYFPKIFASDFSKRGTARNRYNKSVYKKLAKDAECYTNSVCIPIIGSSIQQINHYINIIGSTNSMISVVYLDAPLEVALKQNTERGRTVSDAMIEQNFNFVRQTWEILKSNLNSMNIWRIFRFEPTVTQDGDIARYDLKENIVNQTLLNNRLQSLKNSRLNNNYTSDNDN